MSGTHPSTRARQSRSVDRSTRRYAEWTDAELDEVMRDDLPLHEIADRLGRTYSSVRMRRTLVRKAEQTQRTATPNPSL